MTLKSEKTHVRYNRKVIDIKKYLRKGIEKWQEPKAKSL